MQATGNEISLSLESATPSIRLYGTPTRKSLSKLKLVSSKEPRIM
jgi:hypothetical protein